MKRNALLNETGALATHIDLERCNHPNCVNGIMHEQLSLGIDSIRPCDYCVSNKSKIEWAETKLAKKIKAFIDDK